MTDSVPVPAPHFEGTLDYVRAWIEYRAWATRTPGVQWAIGLKGRVLASGAWGIADLSSGELLTEKHLFRIASHSKTFTATATMILAERGAIRLDDVVATFVPELADVPAGAYTVRDLLSHASGVIRDGYDADYWSLARPFPDENELLAIIRDRSDVIAPSTRLKYSNIGYSLLGLLLSRATGKSYGEAVDELVIEPLGLADTSPEYLPERASDYAAGHGPLHLSQERTRVIRHVDTRAMAAATGFTSTARDLVRYAAAHT
ncbi:MAG: hypothetical protein JWP75_619, partial [Frondihabitans sp.]|nr:hypothetical protein [Frondihabitans sp.]